MKRPASSVASTVALLIALLLWGISLALPSMGARGGPVFTGYEILMNGWQGIRFGVVAWLANPLLLGSIGCTFAGHGRAGLAGAVLGLLLGGSAFWAGELAATFGRPVPELFLRGGFYFWMAAHLAAVTGGVFSSPASVRGERVR